MVCNQPDLPCSKNINIEDCLECIYSELNIYEFDSLSDIDKIIYLKRKNIWENKNT